MRRRGPTVGRPHATQPVLLLLLLLLLLMLLLLLLLLLQQMLLVSLLQVLQQLMPFVMLPVRGFAAAALRCFLYRYAGAWGAPLGAL